MMTLKFGPIIPYLLLGFWLVTGVTRLWLAWRVRRAVMVGSAALRRIERRGRL